MTIEEFERWIVVCSERLGSEPCPAMHFAADVRDRVEKMLEHALAEKDRLHNKLQEKHDNLKEYLKEKEALIAEQARELERLKNILASVDKDHAVSKLMKELERLQAHADTLLSRLAESGNENDKLRDQYHDLLRTAVDLAEIIVGDRQCTYGGHEEALVASPQYKGVVTFLATPAATALQQAKEET